MDCPKWDQSARWKAGIAHIAITYLPMTLMQAMAGEAIALYDERQPVPVVSPRGVWCDSS